MKTFISGILIFLFAYVTWVNGLDAKHRDDRETIAIHYMLSSLYILRLIILLVRWLMS